MHFRNSHVYKFGLIILESLGGALTQELPAGGCGVCRGGDYALFSQEMSDEMYFLKKSRCECWGILSVTDLVRDVVYSPIAHNNAPAP